MKLLLAIINNPDHMTDILDEFIKEKIKVATVLESMGMAHIMAHYTPFFSRFAEFGENEDRNKTLLVVVDSDQERARVVAAIERVVGDLSKSDTGIVMTLPIDYCKGLLQEKGEG